MSSSVVVDPGDGGEGEGIGKFRRLSSSIQRGPYVFVNHSETLQASLSCACDLGVMVR